MLAVFKLNVPDLPLPHPLERPPSEQSDQKEDRGGSLSFLSATHVEDFILFPASPPCPAIHWLSPRLPSLQECQQEPLQIPSTKTLGVAKKIRSGRDAAPITVERACSPMSQFVTQNAFFPRN